MLGTKAGSIAGKVRDNHIVKDDVTSRDLLGFVRGRCCGCSECGKYIIFTKEKYYRKGVRGDWTARKKWYSQTFEVKSILTGYQL